MTCLRAVARSIDEMSFDALNVALDGVHGNLPRQELHAELKKEPHDHIVSSTDMRIARKAV